jgi:AAA+ ATPase superfamily predicted ATPase
MSRLIGRDRDLALLDELLSNDRSEFLLVYGPHGASKTTLLTRWATDSGLPFVYWVASRSTPAMLRKTLAQAIWRLDTPTGRGPSFPTWDMLFQEIARRIGTRRVILILDQFQYAMEACPALTSQLQNAWDHLFKDTNIFLVMVGSHIHTMERVQRYSEPLHGRFTARLIVDPLPFGALAEFFPHYPPAQRVIAYAILGGAPAHLARFNDRRTIKENVQAQVFDRSGAFCLEPFVLIADQVRRPRNYIAIMQAIAAGNHTMNTIAKASGLQRANAGGRYLKRLQEMHFVERRVPVTVRRFQRTTMGRYHLNNHYLRFYFRFVWPNLHLLELGLLDELWETVRAELDTFVGRYSFPHLCQEWIWAQAAAGELPFVPEHVGVHWGNGVKVDVVALNWREKAILLGETRWAAYRIGRSVVRELVEEKTPRVLETLPDRGDGWTVYYALFTRAGLTEAAQTEALAHNALLVDLMALDDALQTDVRNQGDLKPETSHENLCF